MESNRRELTQTKKDELDDIFSIPKDTLALLNLGPDPMDNIISIPASVLDQLTPSEMELPVNFSGNSIILKYTVRFRPVINREIFITAEDFESLYYRINKRILDNFYGFLTCKKRGNSCTLTWDDNFSIKDLDDCKILLNALTQNKLHVDEANILKKRFIKHDEQSTAQPLNTTPLASANTIPFASDDIFDLAIPNLPTEILAPTSNEAVINPEKKDSTQQTTAASNKINQSIDVNGNPVDIILLKLNDEREIPVSISFNRKNSKIELDCSCLNEEDFSELSKRLQARIRYQFRFLNWSTCIRSCSITFESGFSLETMQDAQTVLNAIAGPKRILTKEAEKIKELFIGLGYLKEENTSLSQSSLENFYAANTTGKTSKSKVNQSQNAPEAVNSPKSNPPAIKKRRKGGND